MNPKNDLEKLEISQKTWNSFGNIQIKSNLENAIYIIDDQVIVDIRSRLLNALEKYDEAMDGSIANQRSPNTKELKDIVIKIHSELAIALKNRSDKNSLVDKLGWPVALAVVITIAIHFLKKCGIG